MNPDNLPDDPYRVAPPYCAPGEIEPPEGPQVSEDEAVQRVIKVLKNKQKCAFGDDADLWDEVLADDVLDTRIKLFAALLQNDQSTLALIGSYLRGCVYDRANNWLAEADIEQLDAEGFAP